MNVLILVLSARREPWGELMDCSMETWDAEDHPQTRTLYYCGKSISNSAYQCSRVLCPNIFYSPELTESLEDVSPRTIEAFEKSLEYDWDFMARTHSSTYVHKRNLVEFCETLPKENVLSGLLVAGERPFLWGGGSYIISRDVIEKFVENKSDWDRNVMEDNSITDMAKWLEIPMSGNGRMASIDKVENGYLVTAYGVGEGFTFTDWNDINKAQPHFYFRCKQDLRRHEDLMIFRELKKHLL